MTLPELYTLYRKKGRAFDGPHTVLCQTDWFSSVLRFDPTTGDPMPMALSEFLKNYWLATGKVDQGDVLKDRVWRIVDHARDSFSRLIRELNENPQRRHESMPTVQAKEFDVGCFIKLAGRPGRTFREKLAAKPHVLGVKRFQSVDLQENRLLKACAIKVLACLDLRRDILGEPPDPLADLLRHWLRSDECQQISRWDNTPPNNTLLSHRDYRRVLNAWRWLQTLEVDLNADISEISRRQRTMDFWCELAVVWRSANSQFVDQPIVVDYNDFEISTWGDMPVEFAVGGRNHKVAVNGVLPDVSVATEQEVLSVPTSPYQGPSCVDLTQLRPVACMGGVFETLPYRQLWQEWKFAERHQDLDLAFADAIKEIPFAVTVTGADLFFSHKIRPERRNRAAEVFCLRLSKFISDESLVWLIPDWVADFELETIRRNLNLFYRNAEPLPRSVAALFESDRITSRAAERIRDGREYSVLVVEQAFGGVCFVRLVAEFDQQLLEAVPESKGVCWIREPEQLVQPVCYDEGWTLKEICRVDAEGNWEWPAPGGAFARMNLDADMIAGFLRRVGMDSPDEVLELTDESAQRGAWYYREMKRRAPCWTFWKYALPELYMGGIKKGGMFAEVQLVAAGNVVRPVRGRPIDIPVREAFLLPAGIVPPFPLRRGRGGTLAYYAVLQAPPLSQATSFSLRLRYTYGEDNPYSLTFVPAKGSGLMPIPVKWVEMSDLPVMAVDGWTPEGPVSYTAEQMHRMPGRRDEEVLDLFAILRNALDALPTYRENAEDKLSYEVNRFLAIRSKGFYSGGPLRDGKLDYFFVMVDGRRVYCHRSSLIEELDLEACDMSARMKGSPVWLRVEEGNNGLKGYDVSFSKKLPTSWLDRTRKRIAAQIYHSDDDLLSKNPSVVQHFVSKLRFPFAIIWNNYDCLIADSRGRELELLQCVIERLEGFASSSKCSEKMRRSIRFLMSRAADRSSDAQTRWILDMISDEQWNRMAVWIGMSVGTSSEYWQRYVFESILDKVVNDGSYHALLAFNVAVWRNMELSCRLTPWELERIWGVACQTIERVLSETPTVEEEGPKGKAPQQGHVCALALETLLALLRARCRDERYMAMLSPYGDLVRKAVDVSDALVKVMSEKGWRLHHHVQIDTDVPTDLYRLSPFMYVFRSYMMCDGLKSAIRMNTDEMDAFFEEETEVEV